MKATRHLVGPVVRSRTSPRVPDDVRATFESFDREMTALIGLYGERANASAAERALLDAEIARAEEQVRGAWSRLGAATREPLATHL